MYAIKPETRERWTETLEKVYQVEPSTAETLVDLIVGDPRVSFSRPQTRAELKDTVDSVRTVLEEMDLTEFGDIENPDKLRDELVGMLRLDLGLDSEIIHPEGPRIGGQQGQPTTTVASRDVSKPETILGSKGIKSPSTEEPPAKLAPYIDQLVEKINDEGSEFDQEDVLEMVRWVIYETQGQSED